MVAFRTGTVVARFHGRVKNTNYICEYCNGFNWRWPEGSACKHCGRFKSKPDPESELFTLSTFITLVLIFIFGVSLFFSLNGISVIDFLFRGKNVPF